ITRPQRKRHFQGVAYGRADVLWVFGIGEVARPNAALSLARVDRFAQLAGEFDSEARLAAARRSEDGNETLDAQQLGDGLEIRFTPHEARRGSAKAHRRT